MRDFLATPFMVMMALSGLISVYCLRIACAIKGIEMSEYLEAKVRESLDR